MPKTSRLHLRKLPPRTSRSAWLWRALLFLLTSCSTASVQAQYQFDLWNTDHGLPQNAVQALLQTRDGYLWLTTPDGLVRFDGVRFTVFNKGNTKGLRTNRLTALYEGRDGTLWVGTEGSGIIRYREREFTTYTMQEGLNSNWVWAINEDAAGRIIVITHLGVMVWNEGRFVSDSSEAKLSKRAYGWLERLGGLSFFDGQGLQVFDGRTFRTYTEEHGLPIRDLSGISKDQHGVLWVVTKDAGIFSLRDGVFTYYMVKGLPPGPQINVIYQDSGDTIWIGTVHGLSQFKDGMLTTFPEVKSGVQKIYEDREGTIWIAAGDGLHRVRRQAISVYSEKDGLPGRAVNSIFEDQEGGILLGTWRGGFSRLKDGRFTNYGVKDGLSGNLVNAVYEDREGTIWIGTHDRGLNRFRDGRFTLYGTNDGLGDRGIASIYQDRAGQLWIGTYSGLSIFRDGAFTNYGYSEGMLPGAVQVIYEDRQGRLWLGTPKGLCLFSQGKFVIYTERDGLSSENVRAVYEDREGTIWVGTYDGGLNRFRDGRFTRYTTNEGLFNNGVFQILEDERGYFWMSCNLGIYRVNRQELEEFAAGKRRSITSIAYGKKDGMLNAECNGGHQPSGIRARDGRLWFPTQDGAVVIDPKTIEINMQPPPVVLEDFLLDNRPVDLNGPIEINPGQHNVEIHYTGLSFISSEQVRFKYRLEGLDDDWIDAGTRRNVSYSYVPPGEYTFRVTAANRDGIWNPSSASLRIIVHPPFWRTWWFLCVVFGTLVLIGFLAYRRRVSRLHRARAAQEAFSQQLIESQENERKRIAAELHDSLGQNLLIIKNRALLGALTPDDHQISKTQFDEITASASRAIEEVREIAYDLRPYHLDRLGLTTTIRAMVGKVASACEIDFSVELDSIDRLFTPEQEITLYRILQEAVSNVVRHSRATEARVEVRRNAGTVVLTVWDNGYGFGAKTALAGPGQGGFGLVGIAERVRILGGTHTIRSAPEQGTTLTVSLELPVERKEAEAQ
jgi:signal transduction histidine kinase/ligand-binding sensor domain-containing protein